MSSYADKHRHTATCVDHRCEEDGTKLRMYEGKLYWWCEWHAKQLDDQEQAAG